MSFRPRFLSAIVAIFAFAGVASQVASCTLDTYGTEPPEQATACSTDANCDDKNPCTTDTCQPDGTCVRPSVSNGPLPQQIAGDCRREDCIDGELVPVNDDDDIADDNEVCTTDACSNGNPSHAALMDGTTCTMGTSPGNCVMGVCTVECSPNKPCDDQNPCTEDSCNASLGTCTFIPLDGLPTPGFQEPVGDCKLHICVNGVDAPINDDADVPDDQNSCTQNVCMAGAGTNPGVSLGTPCVVGQPEVCDGQGACVQCNAPADCVLLPVNDDCQVRTCINHMCGQTFTPMGTLTTATPVQTLGDCKRVVCNGNGGTTVENLDADLPVDNNSCTKNICANGVPSNPLEAKDFECGVDQVCDDIGNCVGCNEASQCIGTDDFCKTRTCINKICGYSYTATGTDVPGVQTSQDCKVIECDGMGNIVTSNDPIDKPVDGNQCTQDLCSLGVPSNPFEMVSFPCSQSGGTVCNGAGACKKAIGAVCGLADDCLSGFCVDGVCCNATCGATCRSCNVPGSVGTCVNVPKAIEDLPGCTGTNSCDGAGVCKKDDAQGCSMPVDCVSNFCIDGVCCASSCTTACRACNVMGSVGVCSGITSGEDLVPANACTGMSACDSSGACKLKDGNTCANGNQCISGQCFDGVCCNVACSGTCKSCNITGAVGICSNVAPGQDDANGVPSCSGANQSCDGTGTCKKEIAEACGTNVECLSGFCVDGVCCNGACTATCQACNLPGTVGACTNVTNGQDDVGTCSGANESCDGIGGCKSELGVVCSNAATCLSGFCVDGYCCNTACTGTCQACANLVKGQGSDGTCGPIISGSDPDTECMNGSCNGASTCKLDLGVACGMNSQCLSNFCADGVCCNSACGNSDTTDCQACSTAAGAMINGTCSPLGAGTTCRASGGNCDVAEACDGSATACPANTFVAGGTTCRASAGTCDVVETCTGSSATCPADTFVASGTVCRAAADVCDIDETCSGMAAACPADVLQASGTVCRGAADVCDVDETCNGASVACPADVLQASGTVCRGAADVCDVVETCTGMAVACPADGLQPSGTLCRAAADLCDVDETCTGASVACPANALQLSGTVCRIAIDVCDVNETCTGATAACPADALSPMGTVCRGATDLCDATETCTGMAAACPADVFSASGTVCRPGIDICDIDETCSGMTAACPADAFSPMGTVCRMSAGACDVGETCSGASVACPTDAFISMGTVCRPALGTCDVDEACNGASATCPTDAFIPMGTQCAPPSCMGDSQVNADTCNGIGTCTDNGTTPCTTGYTCVSNTCNTACTGDTDCATGYFCSSNACVLLLTDGNACAASSNCSSGFCVDGICCDTDCTATCMACNVAGSPGTCSNILSGDDDPNATATCSGTTQSCDGLGNCKSDIGAACAMGTDCLLGNCIDGFCCDTTCDGECVACNVAGFAGTCTNIPLGENDDFPMGTCSGADRACDGSGVCLLQDGATCPMGGDTDCFSGVCADGVCCDEACTGTCRACDLAAVGTCSDVALNQDDADTCTGTNQSCDGFAACKLEPGEVCTADGECLSGVCLTDDPRLCQ